MGQTDAIISMAMGAASGASSAASGCMNTLAGMASSPGFSPQMGGMSGGVSVAPFGPPAIPSTPGISNYMNTAALLDIASRLSGLIAPTFTGLAVSIPEDTTGSPPVMDLTGLPVMGELPIIGAAPVLSEFNIPSEPTFNEPIAPTVTIAMTLPDFPSIEYPVFSESLEDLSLPEPPASFEWNENLYSSEMLDVLVESLRDDIASKGTGYSEYLQNRMFAFEQERNALALEDSTNQIATKCANRGWYQADGGVSVDMSRVYVEFNNKRLDRSRDIEKESADRAHDQYKFAITSATAVEGMCIAYHNNVADRSLKSAMATIEMGVALCNLYLARFGAKVERYKAVASVYQVEVQALESKIKVYTSQLEGEKLKAEVEMYKIEIYKSQLEAMKMAVETYKTRVEAVGMLAQVEKTKLDLYRTQVEVFAAMVSAKKVEFDAYRAKVDGQLGGVQAYEAIVKAYTSKLEVAKINADIQVKEFEAQVAAFQARVSVLKNTSEIYALLSNAGNDYNRSIVGLYQAQMMGPEIQAKVSQANAQLVSETGKANLLASIEAFKTRAEAAKMEAAVMAAGISVKGAIANAIGTVGAANVHGAFGAINALAARIETLEE